ncbi:hypothetical protein A3F34_00245 [Candidatus Roizmanbacteria bacterium RIFCSPHIGHO2_12_FULL_44_10]|uniref:EamA domain-containing protein n=1 Tax=Candidatus Roizmanbacteria bacterium RIFCSPHIGHO2_12_FULL_44_10 TaxID=1802054 RepID=A0A1F7I6J3_9BACT|nr:MAG: hypothetical protein A3F34_00245 [Candidatus Roizmanbacteria bacterium RIFCSPHIGHO2_12_FULL_44_10]
MIKLAHKGFIATVAAAFLFALQGILFRYIGVDFGTFYPFVIRGILIVVVLALVLSVTRNYKIIQKKDYAWFLLMPLSGIVSFVTFFIAVNNISVGNTLFLHYASFSITGFILAHIMFHENLSKLKLLSFTLSIIGLIFIFSIPDLQNDLFYLVLAFVSGIGSALWYLFSKKISGRYSYTQIIIIDTGIVSVVCTILALRVGETFHPPSISIEWFSVIAMTIVSLVTWVLIIYGYRHLEAHIASLILLLDVVFGLILALILFAEIPSSQALLGGILILSGVALSNITSKKGVGG